MDHRLLAARLRTRVSAGWRTRFAPAPTGHLHLGHAVNAVHVWGLARALDGSVLLRIEDHDRVRCRPEYEQSVRDDLEWLGLRDDPDAQDHHAVCRQSERDEVYAAALAQLDADDVYACVCSRRDIAGVTPDLFGEETPYPGTCRHAHVDPAVASARRIVMESRGESFNDVALGEHTQNPALQCGDLLARDRSGNWTYQFAVVVDDIEQGIDVVIRGRDLHASTGRQIQLARRLGRADPPVFLHHPLVARDDGAKLSKSDRDTGLRDLRAAGWSAARVLGHAAMLAGLQTESRTLRAEDLGELFTQEPAKP